MGNPHQSLEVNGLCLSQALELLERIDDSTFAEFPAQLASYSVGSQMRHVLDYYVCFLDGLERGVMDYNRRQRDTAVEKDRQLALERFRAIKERLIRITPTAADDLILVVSEDGYTCWPSSIGRELESLTGHTVHHFALIALMLRMQGVAVAPEFGVAPSTLLYWSESATGRTAVARA